MYMNNYLPTTENEFAGNYIVDIIGKDTNYTRKSICRELEIDCRTKQLYILSNIPLIVF